MKKLRIINKILAGLVIVAIFGLFVGIAYSYFVARLSGVETDKTIQGVTGYMEIEYDGGAEINVLDIAPSTEPFITKTFTVTGTNTTESELSYKILLIVDENTFSTDSLSYTLTSINTSNNGAVAPSITERQNINIFDKYLGTGKFVGKINEKIHTYELRLYFYETDYDQIAELDKTFRAHIEIKNDPYVLLKNAILAQGGGRTTLERKGNVPYFEISPEEGEYDSLGYYLAYEVYYDEISEYFSGDEWALGTDYIFNKNTGTFDLINYTFDNAITQDAEGKYVCWEENQVEDCEGITFIKTVEDNKFASGFDIYVEQVNRLKNPGDAGIYTAEDEYGTSFYYRGSKDHLNNNILFAGFQWKIVRINGDGSIRIIYNGTEKEFNQKREVNNYGHLAATTDVTYRWGSYVNDNKYLGYMYGGTDGVASTSREQAVTNQTSSYAKRQLDLWYERNILGTSYESKLADNLFCSDRQLYSEVYGSGIDPGYGSLETPYASYYRLDDLEEPSFKCAQKNDRFTVNDTEIGNGDLSYPIGLITADEVMFAGLEPWEETFYNYLITDVRFWTMTPAEMYTDGYAYMWGVSSSGYFHTSYDLGTKAGLRPVLNLASTVKVVGDGSATNPFRVVD